MSFCRFSSDNWHSDVYVYESEQGYEIHVAANRITGNIPILPEMTHENADAWVKAHGEQLEFVQQAERAPIGGPFDGAWFTLATPGECATKLREIAAADYHVPEYVFEELEDEQDENPA